MIHRRTHQKLIGSLPVALYLGILSLEAYWVTSDGQSPPGTFLRVIAAGAIPAACITFLVAAGPRRFISRFAVSVIVAGILVASIGDLWVYTFFRTRIAPQDLLRNWGTSTALFGILGWTGALIVLVLPILVSSMLILAPPSKRSFRRGVGLGLAVFATMNCSVLIWWGRLGERSAQFVPLPHRLVHAVVDHIIEGRGPNTPGGDARAFQDLTRQQVVTLPPGVRRVVVLTIEAFSAWYSRRISGGDYNLTPKLDRLSEEGVIFKNFFANFGYTEGGIISIYSGLPPIPFRGISRDIMVDYAQAPSLTASLAAQGFQREFFHGSSLEFLNMRSYLEKSFDLVRDVTNDERLRQAPRFVFDGVADEVLYEVALDRIRNVSSDQKLFLGIHTLTSHQPYQHPRGEANTIAAIWACVDTEIAAFVHSLKQMDFFKDGLLIITSDHHDHYTITSNEDRAFRDTALARIPLVILGKGVKPGTVDNRRFQQSDLLRFLHLAISTDSQLSATPVLVDRYTVRHGVKENARQVILYPESIPDSSVRAYLTNDGFLSDAPIPLEAELTLLKLRQQQRALEHVKAVGLAPSKRMLRPPSAVLPSATSSTDCVLIDDFKGQLRWSWVVSAPSTEDYWLDFKVQVAEFAVVFVNRIPIHECRGFGPSSAGTCSASVLVALNEGLNTIEAFTSSQVTSIQSEILKRRSIMTLWEKKGEKIAEAQTCQTFPVEEQRPIG